MPVNKDFSHRLQALDACLRRSMRQWDADALLEEVNRQLEDKWGIKVSRRTLFSDLTYLKEDHGAPIEKYKEGSRVFYYYAEPDYSIQNLPLTGEDVGYLKEAVQMLRQVSNFSILDEVEAIVTKLEHTAFAGEKLQTGILFEQHSVADGAHHLDNLLQAIRGQTALQITYQPFGLEAPEAFAFHPYLLKEYRARWFLIGRKEESALVTVLALDRIKGLKPAKEAFLPNDLFEPDTFFKDLIGVSLPANESPVEITIRVFGRQCSYIRTKPIHHSQQISEEVPQSDCMTVTLFLINNYELRSTLLTYGPDIEVLQPAVLRSQMQALFAGGVQRYD